MILKIMLLCDTCKHEWIELEGSFDYERDVRDEARKERWFIDDDYGWRATCPRCMGRTPLSDIERMRAIAADCGLGDHGGPYVVTIPSDIGATWLAPGLGVRGRVIDSNTIELGPDVKP